jgi:hypothetical protein
MHRFRTAPTVHHVLQEFVPFLQQQFEVWAAAIEKGTFQDPIAKQSKNNQQCIISTLRKDVRLLSEMVALALPIEKPRVQKALAGPSSALLATIAREYDGPGELSNGGPRHDNGEQFLCCRASLMLNRPYRHPED